MRACTERPAGAKRHTVSREHPRGLPGGPLPLLIGWSLPPRDPERARPLLSPPLLSPSPPRGCRRLRAGFLGNRSGLCVRFRPRAGEGIVPAVARQSLRGRSELSSLRDCPGIASRWDKVSACHLVAFGCTLYVARPCVVFAAPLSVSGRTRRKTGGKQS